MIFSPYVIEQSTGKRIDVLLTPASKQDLDATMKDPKWQSDWNSDYLSEETIDKYAIKTADNELIGLGAYQIRGKTAYVYIVYMESAPHSNPTMKKRYERKYSGIGQLLIAYGVKYSVDNGCRGDVLFEAKTDELAYHYEKHFGAKKVFGGSDGIKRYMLADNDAWDIFSIYLKGEEDNE